MQSIINQTAILNKVAPQFLEFIGIRDERHTVGKMTYWFNIMDERHPRYKSTVAFVVPV